MRSNKQQIVQELKPGYQVNKSMARSSRVTGQCDSLIWLISFNMCIYCITICCEQHRLQLCNWNFICV